MASPAIIAFLALSLGAAPAQPARELSAFGDDRYPPLVFADPQGRPAGYDVEVLRLLEAEGLRFRITLQSWDAAKRGVLEGGADLLIGTNRLPEREAQFDFTLPYLENRTVIFVRRAVFYVHSADDLKDRRVAVQRGDLAEDHLRRAHPELSLYPFASQPEALQALVRGEVDAVVGNYFVGLYYLGQDKLEDEVKVVGEPLLVTPYCFAVRKGHLEVRDALDAALRRATERGELEKLKARWFGEAYFRSGHRVLEVLGLALAAIFGVLAISLAFNLVLRARVVRATARLHAAEAHFRALIEHASDLILLLEADGRVRYASPASARLLGLPPQDALGRPLQALVRPDEAGLVERFVREASGERPSTLEAHFALPDGSVRVLEALGRRLPATDADGGGPGTVLVNARDVTERRRAEDALHAERERLAVTLNSIGDGVIAAGRDGRVAVLNRVAGELTGWSPEDAVGRPLSEVYPRLEKASRAPRASPLDACAGSPEAARSEECLLVARGGGEREVAESVAPIRAAGEAGCAGVVVAFRDVTEQNRMRAELERAQRLESLGALAGGIAHDFNNLLSGILGNLSLALDDDGEDGDWRSLARKAQSAAQSSAALAGQLLTFAKGGAPVRKATDLEGLLRESATFALRGRSSRLDLQVEAGLWPAEVDEAQLSQVIQALALNADQAMAAGGTVSLSARNLPAAEAQALGLPASPALQIDVGDTGQGIPAEHLGRVFEPFFSTKAQGRGLGLAVSHSIVRRHGGDLRVRSAVGEGTTFTVFLPAGARAAATQAPAPARAPAAGAQVLVMDDEPFMRELLGKMLARLGFQAVTTEDGKAAVERYRETMATGRFRAVILDLTVPGGMGGREAVGQILALDPQAPLVAASGYSDDQTLAEARALGFRAILPKPFTLATLGAALREATGEDRPAGP